MFDPFERTSTICRHCKAWFYIIVQVVPIAAIVRKVSVDAIWAITALIWKVVDRFDRHNRPKSRGQTSKKHGSDNNFGVNHFQKWRQNLGSGERLLQFAFVRQKRK